MKCCINCFKDSVIRNKILSYGEIGDCDFCSSRKTSVIDLSEPGNSLSDIIISLIQIYNPSDKPDARFLKEALRDDWDIFCGGAEGIDTLVKAICSPELSANDPLFTQRVSVGLFEDTEFIKDNSVVSGITWTQFSDTIKNGNRFFNNQFNSDAFASIISKAVKVYDKGDKFYRARITSTSAGFNCDQMYAPPIGKRSAGRVNPEGIGVLYLSTDDKTVLNETRVTAYDYVTIGTFTNKQTLKIINLSEISRMSPFLYEDDYERYALNREIFMEMASDFAKPVRRNDSSLEYLPTQFISEFVKSEGYDGVQYDSTLREGGINIALFNEDLVECISVKTIEVVNVNYDTKE